VQDPVAVVAALVENDFVLLEIEVFELLTDFELVVLVLAFVVKVVDFAVVDVDGTTDAAAGIH